MLRSGCLLWGSACHLHDVWDCNSLLAAPVGMELLLHSGGRGLLSEMPEVKAGLGLLGCAVGSLAVKFLWNCCLLLE